MGYWKDRMIRQEEQGWNFLSGELYVCADCFDDEFMKDFIKENATEQECTYCEGRDDKPIATSMNAVLEIIGSAISYCFASPESSLLREDGDWVFGESIMDIDEVLDALGSPTANDDVLDDIRDAFHSRQWVEKNFFGLSEVDQLRYGWADFVEAVKRHSRYLFMMPTQEEVELDLDKIPPHKMLDEIGKVVNEVGLVKAIEAGTQWFRARIHDPDKSFLTASELGTVPREKAVNPNRMSPAGIPMFYGASDEATVIAETYLPKQGQSAVASVATFQTARSLSVLDLTELPPMPSAFDETTRHLRPAIGFLRGFIEDLTQAIAKDGREHIDYVPTQIVTEYFRHVFKRLAGGQVNGIIYQSSLKGGTCCVLFFLRMSIAVK